MLEERAWGENQRDDASALGRALRGRQSYGGRRGVASRVRLASCLQFVRPPRGRPGRQAVSDASSLTRNTSRSRETTRRSRHLQRAAWPPAREFVDSGVGRAHRAALVTGAAPHRVERDPGRTAGHPPVARRMRGRQRVAQLLLRLRRRENRSLHRRQRVRQEPSPDRRRLLEHSIAHVRPRGQVFGELDVLRVRPGLGHVGAGSLTRKIPSQFAGCAEVHPRRTGTLSATVVIGASSSCIGKSLMDLFVPAGNHSFVEFFEAVVTTDEARRIVRVQRRDAHFAHRLRTVCSTHTRTIVRRDRQRTTSTICNWCGARRAGGRRLAVSLSVCE